MDRRTDRQFRWVLRSAADKLSRCLEDAPAGSGESPYLDALVLLGHAASLNTEQLFAAFDDEVSETTFGVFEELIRRRCSGTPVSYLRGIKEFYGREFHVGPGVLVPRPDTETLVESAIGHMAGLAPAHPRIHDCCTGSGCVAITLASEARCTVTASDLSEEALAYARRNAGSLGVASVDFWQGDLLEPLRERIVSGREEFVDIITANPPYVADNEVADLTSRGWPEPALALDGGPDGLAFVRRLVGEATACLSEGGCLMVEIGSDQGARAAELFAAAGYRDVEVVRDLGDRDRVCRGRWYKR